MTSAVNSSEIEDLDQIPQGGSVVEASDSDSDDEVTMRDVAQAALQAAVNASISASTTASAEASKFAVGAACPQAALIINPAIDGSKQVAAEKSQQAVGNIINRLFGTNNNN